MYNYVINFQFRPGLLGAPLQLGALSARLVRLWVDPALRAAVTNAAGCGQIRLAAAPIISGGGGGGGGVVAAPAFRTRTDSQRSAENV